MIDRKQVESAASARARSLSADDFAPDRAVLIRHANGTHLFFRHAFLVHHESWRIVFTEHTGFHCFHEEVLDEAIEFVRDERVMAL